MDEGNVRSNAGQQGDGTVHRVGLTRHCIASGLVQLPFALRDTFPEGELLALDVERDEAVVLESLPPRRLAGLAEFFEAHDLQVNDRLEIRIRAHDGGEVRLVAVRSARSPGRREDRRLGADDSAAEPSRESAARSEAPRGPGGSDDAASPASEAGPAPLPDTAVQDALEHGGWSTVRGAWAGPDVVETIGSVTVRRLGAGRFAAPASTTLAQPASTTVAQPAGDLDDEAPSARDARLGVGRRPEIDAVGDADRDADHDATFQTNREEVAEAIAETPAEPAPAPPDVVGRRAPPAPSAPSEPSDVRANVELDPLLAIDDAQAPNPVQSQDRAPAASEPERAPTNEGDAVRQPSLFAARDAQRPPFVAPTRPRSAPGPAARPPTARPPAARPPAQRPPAARHPAQRPAAQPARPEAVELNVSDLADPEIDATVRQRAREEELSRAGDLRSRIVRWLLAPSTPVIVPIERVQHAFDLPVDVAREVVEGVLEEPPPSLRLTRLREDLLRVSRVTVEQDA